MKRILVNVVLLLFCAPLLAQKSVETERMYLSGHGCDDMVQWDFYCTDGRNAGKWTKIGVPSCWELQGFGTYQYGMRFYGKPNPEGIANEKGLYKHEFTLPKAWEGRQILLVFEAVMTDAKVTINGRKAGDGLHQGGFYRFIYDVSDRVFFGKKNRVEVEVAKESANSQVNMAERRADYWNFGGIFRPVFVVAKPARNIERVAVDAGMDGRFKADVFLNRAVEGSQITTEIVDKNGKVVAKNTQKVFGSDQAKVDFNAGGVQLWTAETPNLYTAVFTLTDAQGKTLHRERQKFGFRTIEYRHSFRGEGLKYPHVEGCADDGLFINGKKVIIKGVNRHSFRPETGRTLSKAKNIEDVNLIKSMNMNAVRLSHYPADPEFLEACDSLGLYVECELTGWHWAHETAVGQKLVREMVTRDVNHPSIIFWSNGNEGGFNYELDGEFGRWDPQNRVVLYPWANRNGFETKHYRSWGETAEYMRHKEIFMPTEFLHGLYDGGHGAGLKDYWELMISNPRCAGGFLWDLMDQGVVRTDMDGIVDCVGNFGADGIVGPHMEKEGSYYTIKEIWSPVVIELTDEYDDALRRMVHNHYSFTNTRDCRFTYKYLQMPVLGKTDVKIIKKGQIPSPDIAPGQSGTITLPTLPEGVDAVELTVIDPFGRELYTWSSWTGRDPIQVESSSTPPQKIEMAEEERQLTVRQGSRRYVFSKETGLLQGVTVNGKTLSFGNGPRFVAAKRADRSQDGFYNHDDPDAFKKKTQYVEYADQGVFNGFQMEGDVLTATYRHGSLDQVRWIFNDGGTVSMYVDYHFNGVVDLMGVCFDYPEGNVQSKSWVGKGPYRVWQNRMEGPRYGYWSNSYNDPIPGESWDYPEFKGYFANVDWLQLQTTEGKLGLYDIDSHCCVGVYQPRDGRDYILYELPETGISLLRVIPAVRNKVNTTDLNGPSAQPYWAKGSGVISTKFLFE